jgi:TM2 domain-containing membrane protein YozV
MAKRCPKCNQEFGDDKDFCPNDGTRLENIIMTNSPVMVSPFSEGLAMIFVCLGFLGVAGVHRFYVGKIGTGILWLLTGGLFGIGTIIDIILIASGSFTDSNGRPLKNWKIG